MRRLCRRSPHCPLPSAWREKRSDRYLGHSLLRVGQRKGQGHAMAPVVRTASCSCGQLRMLCEEEPIKVSVCHCLDCQRRTGSAFGIAAFYLRERTTSEGLSSIFIRASDSGFEVAHHFCPHCGSTVFWYPSRKPGAVAVAVGCFADSTYTAPDQQVYEHHRHHWLGIALGRN